MMKNLKLDFTKSTPLVELNYEEGELKFSGRSFMDNPTEFYNEIYKWIYKYIKNPQDETDVYFEFEFLNTGSSRIIFDIIKCLSTLDNVNFTIKIEEDDEDMFKLFKKFEYILNAHFNIIEIMY
jgi:hypothetical protein